MTYIWPHRALIYITHHEGLEDSQVAVVNITVKGKLRILFAIHVMTLQLKQNGIILVVLVLSPISPCFFLCVFGLFQTHTNCKLGH